MRSPLALRPSASLIAETARQTVSHWASPANQILLYWSWKRMQIIHLCTARYCTFNTHTIHTTYIQDSYYQINTYLLSKGSHLPPGWHGSGDGLVQRSTALYVGRLLFRCLVASPVPHITNTAIQIKICSMYERLYMHPLHIFMPLTSFTEPNCVWTIRCTHLDIQLFAQALIQWKIPAVSCL